MSVENEAATELSAQELDVVAGGQSESFAPTKFPEIDISNYLKDVKLPNFWPSPYPTIKSDKVTHSETYTEQS